MAENIDPSSIPTEIELVSLTVSRIEAAAEILGISPPMVCRRCVNDNRIWTHLIARRDALQSGDKTKLDETRSVTMSLYDRLHSGLTQIEAERNLKQAG